MAPDVQTASDQLILTHFAPCGVVVDSKLQVWHFRGRTAPFLEHAPGVASLNILKMVRHDLSVDLSAAIHQALKTGDGVRKEGMLLADKNGRSDVQLEVIPFKVGRLAEQWLLIIFETRAPALPAVLRGKARHSQAERNFAREISRLRAELASTKDSLQAIIEEQEAANEEIKSANEEIESSNEELQSTNEELETKPKEELQSTNEELHDGQRGIEQPQPGNQPDQPRPEQSPEQHPHRDRDGGQRAHHPAHHAAGGEAFRQHHPRRHRAQAERHQPERGDARAARG